LDLFAGTGALSFEALSRGAARAVLVDRDARAIRELCRSAESLGLGEKTEAVRLDLLGDPRTVARRIPGIEPGYDLVFSDAPYAEIEEVPALLAALCEAERLRSNAWVVVERPASREWAWPNGLAPVADYRYGQTGISLGRYEPEKGMS
jgi:16S rRNA (guanine966-N2)-methyltransferase